MKLRWLLVLALAGCGGDGGGIDPTPDLVIAKTSGDGQEGIVGQPLADPIQVLVTEGNAPVAGVTVTWQVDISEGTFSPESVKTDADGLASTFWTLGPRQGDERASVQVTSGTSNPSIVFTATALHDVPAALTKVSGDNQRAIASTRIDPIVAKVADQFDNGVEGVEVSWTISSGTLTPRSDFSGPGGVALADVDLGPSEGPVTITAASDGLSGSPLTFTATAVALRTTADVLLGNIFFTSVENSSTNPAVDTIAVGGTVTWTWRNTGIAEHSVRSQGTPSFTGSARKLGNGQTYTFTFTAPGIYSYDCAVHGSRMTGRIVVK
jgi:plastocyanin